MTGRVAVLFPVFLVLLGTGTEAQIASKTYSLSSGQAVPAGRHEAVGRLQMGCSASLIGERLVLTAAHCVCPSENHAKNCASRTTFTLTDVRPAGNPAKRTDVSLSGMVIVHPNYTVAGWLRSDYALVVLDQPAWKVVTGVSPLAVADAAHSVRSGDLVTLVGYGATGADCANAPVGKLELPLRISDVVPEAIRFNHVGDVACPGDSGGPALNRDGWVVGVASWTNSVDESTYRPTWEAFDWISTVRTAYEDAGPAEGTVVFAGTSRDLDAYRPAQPYALKPGTVGVAGISIASDDVVFVWYLDGTVSAGDTQDLTSRRAPYPYSLPPGKTPRDIVEIGIAGSNDHVYAWYADGTVSSGTSSDLDAYRPPQPYTVPAGKSVEDIVGIDIAGSNDRVYAWYRDDTVSSGSSRDLGASTPPHPVSLPPERQAGDVVAQGIAKSDDHVYTWFRPYLR